MQHATWEDRARLQMMDPEDIQFPVDTTETEKWFGRDMIDG